MLPRGVSRQATMKTIIKVCCILLLPVIVLRIWWFTTGETIVLYRHQNHSISLELPNHSIESVIIDYECTITLSLPDCSGSISLLYNAFERPDFVWFSEKKRAVYVVYQRDTEVAFLVVEPKRSDARVMRPSSQVGMQIEQVEAMRPTTCDGWESFSTQLEHLQVEAYRRWQLERIVRQIDRTVLQVRYFTSDEFTMLIHIIERLSTMGLQRHTYPFKIWDNKGFYAPAKRLLHQLQYFQNSQKHFSDERLILGTFQNDADELVPGAALRPMVPVNFEYHYDVNDNAVQLLLGGEVMLSYHYKQHPRPTGAGGRC